MIYYHPQQCYNLDDNVITWYSYQEVIPYTFIQNAYLVGSLLLEVSSVHTDIIYLLYKAESTI